MLKVTTETGRQYLIDTEGGFWWRLNKTDGSPGWTQRLWFLKRGTHFGWPHESPEGAWEDGLPEVGKFMYISSKDEWYVSTEVVSVEEVDDEE